MLKLFKKTAFTDEELFSFLLRDDIPITKDEIQKARNDDGKTLYDIGNKYSSKNYHKALAWYRKAAFQNISQAQYVIGWMYHCGKGVSTDYQQAMEWFLNAANNDGNKEAQWMIGQMYRSGKGVPKNILTAIEWYTKAANQDYALAQYYLGNTYEEEKEVKDLQKAVNWYKKSDDNGWECSNDITRLDKQGYHPKEDTKESEEKTMEVNSNNSGEDEISDKNINSKTNNKEVQAPSTNKNTEPLMSQNDELLKALMEEKIKNLEKSFQLQLQLLLKDKNEKEAQLQQRLNSLEQKQTEAEIKQKQKDEENNQLKESLAQYKAIIERSSYNDIYYESPNENETDDDDSNDSANNDGNNGETQHVNCGNKTNNEKHNIEDRNDDNEQDDINYDSTDSEEDGNINNTSYNSSDGNDKDGINDSKYDSSDHEDRSNDIHYD